MFNEIKGMVQSSYNTGIRGLCMKYCLHCGASLPENDNYCNKCRKPQTEAGEHAVTSNNNATPATILSALTDKIAVSTETYTEGLACPLENSNGKARFKNPRIAANLVYFCVILLTGLNGYALYRGIHLATIMRSYAPGYRLSKAVPPFATLQNCILAMSIFLGIAFLLWVFCTYKNLTAFGDGRTDRTSPGWAVAGFVIPVLNLVRPYQVIKEIWQRSSTTKTTNATIYVLSWWLIILGSKLSGIFLVSRFDSAMTLTLHGGMNIETLAQYVDQLLYVYLAAIVSLVITGLLVYQISSMQIDRANYK
jgi:hypothetical protein